MTAPSKGQREARDIYQEALFQKWLSDHGKKSKDFFLSYVDKVIQEAEERGAEKRFPLSQVIVEKVVKATGWKLGDGDLGLFVKKKIALALQEAEERGKKLGWIAAFRCMEMLYGKSQVEWAKLRSRSRSKTKEVDYFSNRCCINGLGKRCPVHEPRSEKPQDENMPVGKLTKIKDDLPSPAKLKPQKRGSHELPTMR